VAPTVRSFSADIEPLRLIAQFPDTYPGLLESSAPVGSRASGGGRFDILPMSSGECLRLDCQRRLSGPHAASAGGFLDALETWWRAMRLPALAAPLPFTGGWLLYLGYELSAEIEPRLKLPPSPDAVIALAMRTPAAWIRDRATLQAWLVAEPGAESLLDDFEAHVREVTGPAAVPRDGGAPPAGTARFEVQEEDPARFVESVTRTLEYIAAGDIYQANLSRQWLVTSDRDLDPVAIYERLRSTNPSPFAAMMRYGDFSLMSSSPERLLSIRGGIVSTRPIAGTRPRGTSPETDAALVQSLLSNEKERAEHVMLIDLERNDLGRVCVGGTVRVDEYMVLETYAHVHHIVSNVSGRLREDVSPVQVLRALFPGGTITGCPKVRCMEIIAELEGAGRGAYTGSIGYLNRDGSCDLNILIRTLTGHGPGDTGSRSGAPITFRAGAGIVAGSHWYAQKENRDSADFGRRLQEARARLDNARRERESLKESSDVFRTLVDRGLLQTERRLELVELVNTLRARYQIMLDYEIAPQRPLALAGGRVFSSVDVLASRVKLKARALHEGDILSFIESLTRNPQGFYPVDRCAMKRIEVPDPDSLQPRVEADCTLEWITLKEKRGAR